MKDDVTNQTLIRIIRDAGNLLGRHNGLGRMGDDYAASAERSLDALRYCEEQEARETPPVKQAGPVFDLAFVSRACGIGAQ